MKDSRVIDFRYQPSHAQVCVGLVDDPHKTIVRDDGSVNFGFHGRDDAGYYRRMNESLTPTLDIDQINRGFHYRLKPRILHRDRLVSSRQEFGDPRAAIVTTVEDYEKSVLSWRVFAWRTDSGARADVILWTLEAKPGFIATRSGVAIALMGRTEGLPPLRHAPRAGTDDSPRLSAGGRIEGATFIVHEGALADGEATLDAAKGALEWARAYWASVAPFLVPFSIPDRQIMDMLAACGRNIL